MPSRVRPAAPAFFAAYTLSAFGYEFITFAMTVHLFKLTNSAVNIGIFTAILAVSKLFLPLTGTLTDRFRKANSLGIAALGAGLLIALLAFASQLWQIYLVWFLSSLFFTFIVNVRTALMTELMPSGSFLKGNSLVFLFLNLAKIAAPALGGLLAWLFDARGLFLATAAVYVLVALSTRLVPHAKATVPDDARLEETAPRGPGTRDQIRQAFAHLGGSTKLKALGLLLVSKGLFMGFQISLFVAWIKGSMGLDSAHYGFFLTVSALGSISGSLVGPLVARRFDKFRIIVAALPVHYALFIAMGFTASFAPALVLVFFSSFAFFLSAIAVHSIRDGSTPADLRGTVYGLVHAMNAPVAVVSMLAGAWGIETFGVSAMFVFGGAAAGLALVAVVLPLRVLGEEPAAERAEAAEPGVSAAPDPS